MNLKTKLSILSILLLLIVNLNAQSPPTISFKDYGFSQLVTKVETVYYNLKQKPIEKSTHEFNENGFIERYHIYNLKNHSWETSKSRYKKDRLHKRVFEYSDSKKNRKHYYTYNREAQLTEEDIKWNNRNNNRISYSYQNDLLYQIKSGKNSTITTYYYSIKGILYKAIKREKSQNQTDLTTNYFYLEGKEITSYISPKRQFKVTSYLDHYIVQFDLSESDYATERLLKGMQRFDKEAPIDNLPFNLEQYSNQTLQFYSKHKDKLKLTQVLLFDYKTDSKNNNIAYAEADIDLNTNTIRGIRFYKTTLADETVIGNTEFDDKVLTKFEDILAAINSF